MPNICTANIIVRGRKDCVDEFINILNADYSYYNKKEDGSIDFSNNKWCTDPKNFTHIPHFFRIFEVYDLYDYYASAVYKCVELNISCAWSVFVCMFPGKFSYYDNFERDHHGEHYGTNIIEVSKRLQLEIEIWSREEGLEFQEHYKICSGVLVINQELDIQSYNLENISYNQYVNNTPENVKESIIEYYGDINNEEEYEEFKDECGPSAPVYNQETYSFEYNDKPIYLCNLVMVKEVK